MRARTSVPPRVRSRTRDGLHRSTESDGKATGGDGGVFIYWGCSFHGRCRSVYLRAIFALYVPQGSICAAMADPMDLLILFLNALGLIGCGIGIAAILGLPIQPR
jgi:hypothetical protein